MKCYLRRNNLSSRNYFRYRKLSSVNGGKYHIFRTLGLETFQDEELHKCYREICPADCNQDLTSRLEAYIRRRKNNAISDEDVDAEAKQIAAFLMAEHTPQKSFFSFSWIGISTNEETKTDSVPPKPSPTSVLSFEDFRSRVRYSAEELDSRIPKVAASAVLTGTSLGIIIPCMPILVQTIGMPPSEFGIVIAAFGISKMIGNMPSAYLVDNYGRKPAMVSGLALCGLGIGGIGLTLVDGFGTPWLIGCRLVSGLGVSAFIGGTTMLLADISTPLNNTRTASSVMLGFTGGMALGPALGGAMVGSLGVGPTYLAVGGCFAAMASLQHFYLEETMPGKTLFQRRADDLARMKDGISGLQSSLTGAASLSEEEKPVGVLGSFKVALLSWNELMKRPALRDVLLLQGAYATAIAGAQLTLLPLMMVGPALHLGASDIGYTFALMAITGTAAATPIAHFADKYGKLNCMLNGCVLVATSLTFLPYADSLSYVLAATVPLAVGTSCVSAPCLALVSDMVSSKDRAQAQALNRTCGDVGLLIGATSAGLIADATSIESAISGFGVLLAGCTASLGVKRIRMSGLLPLPFAESSISAEESSMSPAAADVQSAAVTTATAPQSRTPTLNIHEVKMPTKIVVDDMVAGLDSLASQTKSTIDMHTHTASVIIRVGDSHVKCSGSGSEESRESTMQMTANPKS